MEGNVWGNGCEKYIFWIAYNCYSFIELGETQLLPVCDSLKFIMDVRRVLLASLELIDHAHDQTLKWSLLDFHFFPAFLDSLQLLWVLRHFPLLINSKSNQQARLATLSFAYLHRIVEPEQLLLVLNCVWMSLHHGWRLFFAHRQSPCEIALNSPRVQFYKDMSYIQSTM